jgi:hypothetical protein
VWVYSVNHSQRIQILTSQGTPQPDVRMAAVAFTTVTSIPASKKTNSLERPLVKTGG